MILNSVFRCSAVLFFFAIATNGWAATYDPAADFEKGFLGNSNPNGVWSYGSSTNFTTPVSLYGSTTQTSGYGPYVQCWYPKDQLFYTPWLCFNNGPDSKTGGIDVLYLISGAWRNPI